VISEEVDTRGRRRFVIRPNRSLSWRGNMTFIGVMGVLLSVIAATFALRGAWPVLPFAGLELAALAAGLYWVARRLSLREVITVDDGHVTIERGHRRPELRARFPRAWLRVELVGPRGPLAARRLVLRSHGRSLEIGALLTEAERERLAARLRAAIREAAPASGAGSDTHNHRHPTGGDGAR